jgi:DNA (cytosine-5)-methyltransferase 1
MNGSEYSSSQLDEIPEESMLRTPSAIEGEGGAIREDVARAKNRMLMVRDQMAQLAYENGLPVPDAIAKLPTPMVMDRAGAMHPDDRKKSGAGYGPALRDIPYLLGTPRTSSANGSSSIQVATGAPKSRLEDQAEVINNLPTPTTRDHKDGTVPHERDGVVQVDTVARAVINSGEVTDISWGKFEPAIRRWERVTGRPAPAPTEATGKNGTHRLSSKLTEWMMGLPDGWITGHGLSRTAELKLAGNGVCPQQAVLALTLLTQDLELE